MAHSMYAPGGREAVAAPASTLGDECGVEEPLRDWRLGGEEVLAGVLLFPLAPTPAPSSSAIM